MAKNTSSSISAVRGMKDLFGVEAARFRHLVNQLQSIANSYNCQEISTPIVESLDVFKRSLGDTSDVVSKEMYTLEDRKGTPLVLRPEGTAGICRAVVNHKPSLPSRYWYTGPMFRYERPQKGRQRQFHQLGVEFFGEPSPMADIDGLSLAYDFIKSLGIQDFNLEINSLGDMESRQHYQEALLEYLYDHQDNLSDDSKVRLKQNPLRILDSKDDVDKAIVEKAPKLSAYLTDTAQQHIATVLEGLETLAIPYTQNEQLVRGLDYYNHTVFEFTTNALGAQGTILAGGRYDSLVSQLGGPETPGFGWAAGMERLELLLLELPEQQDLCVVLLLDESGWQQALHVLEHVRRDYTAILLTGKNLGKLMKKANNQGARFVAIVGRENITNNDYTLKDMQTGAQKNISIS